MTSSSNGQPLLSLEDVHVYYGNIAAVKGLTMTVMPGEIVTLIGSNGAGKSTTLRSISGVSPAREGSIVFDGEDITTVPPQEIVQRGISQSPEGRHVFPRMTVRENLDMGAYTRRDRAGSNADLERVLELFPRLRERRKQPGGTLSGGEQQMLAVGRALMSRPRLLLMDEPSLGLAPLVVEEIFRTIAELHREGTTVFLVEQNAHMALQVAQHFFLMEQGRISFSGNPGSLAEDEIIRRAYLGTAR